MLQFSAFFSLVYRGRPIGSLPSKATVRRRRHASTGPRLPRPERCEYSSDVGCVRNVQYSRRGARHCARRPWPPISSTLLFGLRDAVLVDSLSLWSRPGLRPIGLPPREKKSDNYLCNSRARRSLLRGKRPFGVHSIQGWAAGTPADSEDTLRFAELSGVRPMMETYPLERAGEAYAC